MNIVILWAENVARMTGGVVHLLGWRQGLLACGHRVWIYGPHYRGQPDSVVPDVHFFRVPRRTLWSFVLVQWATVLLLPFWLWRRRPEVLMARSCFLAFLMRPICWWFGTRLILEGGSSPVDEEMAARGQSRWLARVVGALSRWSNRAADGIVCVTQGTRDELVRRGAAPETTVVIHNGANTEAIYPLPQSTARRQLGLPEAGYVVGFAGSLVAWQGLDLLVEAADLLRDRLDRPVRFLIAGTGSLRGELDRLLAARGLADRFTFLPPRPYSAMPFFLGACDATVIPIHDKRKLRYGLDPLKFWDSLAAGVPVLIPAGCGLEPVLGHVGVPGTFRPGDAGSLAEALAEALAGTDRFQARRQEIHRIMAEQYSWKHIAEQLTRFAEGLIAGDPSRVSNPPAVQ